MFKLSSDVLNTTAGTIDGCQKFDRTVEDGATAVWMKDEELCRVELTDGRVLVINKINKTSDTSKGKLSNVQCPAPVCKRVMDLVIVLDISFSICTNDVGYETNCELSDWVKIQKFTENIINSFDIGEDATMVGIVTFCGDANDVVEISSDKKKIIDSLYNVNKMGYATCIGCGVENAINMFKRVSANREARKPEKMVIFMTDGGNNKPDQRGYVAYCADYQPKCKRYTNKCKRYGCNETNPQCIAYSDSNCTRYTTTNVCERFKCASCKVPSVTRCLRRSTSSCFSYVCLQNSTTPVCGHPDCCSWSGSRCRNDNYCWWKCSGVTCQEIGYTCLNRQCVEYACLEYDCDECTTNSTTCLEYKKTCAEPGCVQYNCTEVCAEYECAEYELECVAWRNGYDGHFHGVTSILHSPYGLMPQSSTPIVTIAIGVGHEIDAKEVRRVSSTMEGKKLYYTLDNFDQLSGIINELVDETCTKMTENLESCSDKCHGLCGCEKKCYCPTCDTGDNCTHIKCSTDTDSTESTGCKAEPVTCTPSSLCVNLARDPNYAGCCKETEKNCSGLSNACYQASCTPELGCYLTEIDATPVNGCSVGDYCDNITGWHYKDTCPSVGLCNHTVCTPDGATGYTCSYPPVCPQTDPCNISTCDAGTGQCKYEPIVCNASTPCNISVCVEGMCVESVNAVLYNECRKKANNSCEVGYCNVTTGQCEVEDISVKNPSCGVCDIKPPDCTKFKTTPCLIYECGINEDNETYCEFVKDECPASTDPCKINTCDMDREDHCRVDNVNCTIDKCHIGRCVTDPNDPTKYQCEQEPVCKSDVCYSRTCNNETGDCSRVSLCPHKPCHTFDYCNVLADGSADCHYVPKPRKADTSCSYTYCDEEKDDWAEIDNSSNCNGDDPCMEYNCYPVTGCSAKPINCNDNDPCTIDYCAPYNSTASYSSSSSSNSASSGSGNEENPNEKWVSVSSGYDLDYVCVHKPKCYTEKFCERASCSVVDYKCSYSDYTCDDYPGKDSLDNCHTVKCDEESRSCKVVLLPSAFLDVCGSCIKTYGTNATLNITHAKTACIGGMKATDFAATIAGATIAVIVIVCIIAAAAIGVASAIGTRELVKRAKKNADATTNSNPLYEGNENEASNPAFTGEN